MAAFTKNAPPGMKTHVQSSGWDCSNTLILDTSMLIRRVIGFQGVGQGM